jgi:hypothetical protein
MVKRDRYCDCGHTEFNHDTGWDASGCMVSKCYCRAFRDSYDFGAEADRRYEEERDRTRQT